MSESIDVERERAANERSGAAAGGAVDKRSAASS